MSLTSKTFWPEPKSNCFVYGLIDPRDNKIKYIGQTTSGIQRFRQHYYNKKTEGTKSKKVNWINKLKSLGLVFQVIYLEYADGIDKLNELEIYYIKKFRNQGIELLNHSDGGDNVKKDPLTEEEKLYLSKKSKEAWQDPIKRFNLLKWRKGRQSALFGKKRSEAFKQKIKEANKKRSIKIIDSNNKIYPSYLQASKELNCTPTDIRRCILNPNKQINGLTFKKVT